MKKFIILLVFSLIIISCGKKEIKKETINEQVPFGIKPHKEVKKETIEEEKPTKVVFTVQIAALKDQNFKLNDIEGIHVYEEENLIKYRLGQFNTYKEARIFRKSIYNNYKDAFIQALKNDEPINIREALN